MRLYRPKILIAAKCRIRSQSPHSIQWGNKWKTRSGWEATSLVLIVSAIFLAILPQGILCIVDRLFLCGFCEDVSMRCERALDKYSGILIAMNLRVWSYILMSCRATCFGFRYSERWKQDKPLSHRNTILLTCAGLGYMRIGNYGPYNGITTTYGNIMCNYL